MNDYQLNLLVCGLILGMCVNIVIFFYMSRRNDKSPY